MSVTIMWSPVAEGTRFHGGTSTDLAALTKVFGSSIGESHVAQLRAMYEASQNSFYKEVADIVENVGSIEFWGEY